MLIKETTQLANEAYVKCWNNKDDVQLPIMIPCIAGKVSVVFVYLKLL